MIKNLSRFGLLHADAAICRVFPRLARWTAVVADSVDGEQWPIPSVKAYRRASVVTFVDYMTGKYALKLGVRLRFEIRELPRPVPDSVDVV